MSDLLTINLTEESQSFTVAIQEAQDGADGANGITPQLRATGTAIEADSGDGFQTLIELSSLPFVSLSGNQTAAGTKTFTGNVGIGTAPTVTLDVQGPTGTGSTGVLAVRGYDAFGQSMVLYPANSYSGNAVLSFKSNGGAMGMGVNFSGGTPQYYDFTNAAGGSIVRIMQTGSVGIGSTSPAGRLHVETGAAATVGVVVKGSASQSGDYLRVQNSAGTNLFRILSTGAISSTQAATFSGAVTAGSFSTAGAVNFTTDLTVGGVAYLANIVASTASLGFASIEELAATFTFTCSGSAEFTNSAVFESNVDFNGPTYLAAADTSASNAVMNRAATQTEIRDRAFKRTPLTCHGGLVTQTGGVQTNCAASGSSIILGNGSAPTTAGGDARFFQSYCPSIFTDGATSATYAGFGAILDFTAPHAIGFVWGTPSMTTTTNAIFRIQLGGPHTSTNGILGIATYAGYGVKIWQNSSSLWNVALYGRTQTNFNENISGATNASPIVITSNNHNLQNGDLVEIQGVLGNTAANGTWTVAGRTANTFQLAGSTGNGAFTSNGAAQKITAPITMAAGVFKQMFLVSTGTGTVSLRFGSLSAADSLTLTGMGSVSTNGTRSTGQTSGFAFGYQNVNSTTAWYSGGISNVDFYLLN